VRSLAADYVPETIRHHVGLFRRIVGKARGQYQLPPIDWDLITLPAVDNEHAMKNRLNAEQIAVVLPVIVEQYPFYAPMIFALYTLGLRYCHVAAMRESKLSADGVIAIEESYDVSANVFGSVDPKHHRRWRRSLGRSSWWRVKVRINEPVTARHWVQLPRPRQKAQYARWRW